jgi:hypothetical protein
MKIKMKLDANKTTCAIDISYVIVEHVYKHENSQEAD